MKLDSLSDEKASYTDRPAKPTSLVAPMESNAPNEAIAQPPSIQGYLDRIEGLDVIGWARAEAADSLPVTLDVLADDRWVASGVASLYREDLLEAGIGTGRYGFRISLPVSLCDSQAHEISVQAGCNAQDLGPMTVFQHEPRACGHVEGLSGAFVVGWVSDSQPLGSVIDIDLHVDGKLACSGTAAQRVTDGFRFALRLPSEFMDARPHIMSVTVRRPFLLVGEFATVTPAWSTPDDALQRYAGAFLSAASLNGAGFRYEALRTQLINLTSDHGSGSAPEQLACLRQISLVHDLVVRGFASSELRREAAYAPLEFPAIAQPLVSVVIPVHNKFPVTYNCLAALLLAPNHASFEVIVVDDGSSDATLDMPGLLHGVTCLRHEEARGFVQSCNYGGGAVRGQYIVMLNNDTEVTPRWIDELLYVFENFDGVGMTGAKLLYPNGALQEAGGIVWNSGEPWNYGRGGNAMDPRYNYIRQVDYLSGACLMMSKKLWAALGGFDEHFAPAYFEDTDLAFRVRERGLKTVYTPFAQVIHYEGLSSGTSTDSGIKRYQNINKPKFKARWHRAFRGNGNVGKDVELIKDRNVRFRALVIDYVTPQPDRDAGSYAAIQEMRLLQSLGAKLTFIPDNLAYLGDYTSALQRMGVECVYAPFAISVGELLERRGSEFDLVYVTRYSIAERHIDAIRTFAPRAKVLFNNADLHFLRQVRDAMAFTGKDSLERALKTRDDELAVMRKVDLVLSYNDVEHAVILSHNLDSTRVARCPWVVELPDHVPSFESRRDIAFLGAFLHYPNVDAVTCFVREVMPLMRKRLPGVALRIYGSNMPEDLVRLAAQDILMEGWVRNVSEVYDTCRVFVAPLLTGAGIKGKVLGALAYGVPCVLSPMAAEGTGVRDGLEALIATRPVQWVECVARLYEDSETWLTQSRTARTYAEREYGFAKGQRLMQEALETLEIYSSPDDACLVPVRVVPAP
jgi:O-antigen biosynthesis protein